ncbi:Hsp20/alpha crystallin family protein [Algibacter pectinivorans]|uniref:Molecular chaperone IbpA, HSP20 family n=1 Tax=Algibacter pectinivorans TaxID=870482 RepID=A0A1I1P4Y4_9FLAO|nr:Hsp20/alpha crystallin family protein [Algibacter pectinivorans]SFD04652.1 Molecular chaperone IbpA, HSP20 family [Algibacter pectinivorans]
MSPLSKTNRRLSKTYKRYFSKTNENPNLKVLETDSSFHYELEIPGYVKEDFNFYISRDNLVVTTDKSNLKQTNAGDEPKKKHAYCYPSAYFKMRIPLPRKLLKKEILVNYKNKILSFDLLKLQDHSDEGLLI